jgi:hypothetical protein
MSFGINAGFTIIVQYCYRLLSHLSCDTERVVVDRSFSHCFDLWLGLVRKNVYGCFGMKSLPAY